EIDPQRAPGEALVGGGLEQRQGVELDAIALLLVEEGGVEPETSVLDAEFAFGLGDAALAQEDSLSPFRQRSADDGPFLQGVSEHDGVPRRACIILGRRRARQSSRHYFVEASS